MLIKPPDVYDVFLITPSLNEDERGFIYEFFNQNKV